MTLLILAAVLLLVLVLLTQSLWSRRPARRLRALAGGAEQAGLALTADIVPALSTRLAARNLAVTVGGAIGTACFGAGLALDPAAAAGPSFVLVLFGGLLVGSVIGTAVSDSRTAFAAAAENEGPRLARSPVPTRIDYVGRSERLFTPVALLLAVVIVTAAGLLIRLSPAHAFDGVTVLSVLGLPLALLAVAVATTIAGRLAIARLLDRGQPATTLTALAWDDALRSLTVRGLSTTPGIIAVIACYVCAVSLATAAAGDGTNEFGSDISGWLGWIGPILVILLSAASITLASAKTTQHYLRRLWPQTAAERERLRPSRVPQYTPAELESHDPDA